MEGSLIKDDVGESSLVELWVHMVLVVRGMKQREAFWNYLNDCLQSFGANVNIVLLGDLNALVGDEVVKDMVGRHGVPGRNENGKE